MDDETNRPPPKTRSAFVDILLAALYGDAAAAVIGLIPYFTTRTIEYGWSTFAFLPIVSGVIVGIYLRQREHDVSKVLLSSLISVTLPALGLLFWQTEGMACLVMASPFALGVHFLAALIGGAVAGSRGRPLQIEESRQEQCLF